MMCGIKGCDLPATTFWHKRPVCWLHLSRQYDNGDWFDLNKLDNWKDESHIIEPIDDNTLWGTEPPPNISTR